MRIGFVIVSTATLLLSILVGDWSLLAHNILLIVFVPLTLLGYWDMVQKKHAILRNFPIFGHFRYLLEMIRPEINQYFIESNMDGRPFNREQRSLVYQRAKLALQTLPFGTQQDLYNPGVEWLAHSAAPTHVAPGELRTTIGVHQCKLPYSASLMNVSAMSFGSLSANAILALNGGARLGAFAHNTGEGGLSPHHLAPGGDLIWQIGTGYFGCRNRDGQFDAELFQEKAVLEQVKMVEIKLSQGAKPAHGGILPAGKVTKEIAEIRHVPLGQDVLSPPAHRAFSNPMQMMDFISELRELSGGKPVGIKLCVGRRHEVFAMCKAMVESGIHPDYIAVDGAEGGTGAAPLEFSNQVGTPLLEGLNLVNNALIGFGLRPKVHLIASGRVISAYDIIQKLAMGADLVYSARAMMFALGCIQALRCNANICPTGVATQDPALTRGLVVEDKRERVANYHRETMHSVAEMLGAIGLSGPSAVRPWHVLRRINEYETKNLHELYPLVDAGSFLHDHVPKAFRDCYDAASADTWQYRAL